jgi:hypothetical protein
MSFAAYWWRASIRRRWRALVGIALLLGIIGGLSLFAIAGARRTQSAYPRFLRSTNPSTMAVDVGGLDVGGGDVLAAIAELPQVVQARAYAAFYVAPWVDGQPDLTQNFEAIGSVDGRYFDQDVFTPTKGRRPDPGRVEEVAVNEESARRYGYRVGQQLDLATVSRDQVETSDPSEAIEPKLLMKATIVGIGTFIEEVMQDDTDRSPLLLLTPAYVEQAREFALYAWQGLVLRNGEADVAAVKQVINEHSDPGSPQIFRVTSIDVFHAQQAVRPVSLALGAFGAIAALAGLVLVSQAISRHVRSEREEHTVARAIGADPRDIGLAAAAGPTVAVVAGTLLAFVVAALASPAMPIGPVRRVEVASGIDIDWTVLGLGGLAMLAMLLVVTAIVARREAPHRVQQRSTVTRPARRGLLARSAGLPAPIATGLRLAFEPGSGSTAVPVRSVMAGAAIAAMALVAAVTFGASLDRLVSHPRLFGWDWDVALVAGAGYGNTNPAATQEVLGNDPDIAAWSGAFFGGETIDSVNVPVLGMNPGSEVAPPIRDGRMIERPGEIVVGTGTLATLHKHIGDTVSSSSGPLRVVGTTTLPTIGQVHGDHTSLGVGAILVTEQVPGFDRNVEGKTSVGGVPLADYGPNVLFVRFRPGADRSAVVDRLNGAVEQIGGYSGLAVTPVQRSAEIVNADDIRGSSTLLGLAVAIAALASLTVALTSAVRRRRRDLALLKSLGFTRRQLSMTVASQASATIVVGLLVGVPMGVVLGRVLWVQFAGQLDVLAEPAVPLAAIALVVVAAVAVANLLSALPARYARAVPASLVLRSE